MSTLIICEKTAYDNYKLAQDACSHIRYKRGFKVYKCPDCGKFHLASIRTSKKTFRFKDKYKPDFTKVKVSREKKIAINPVKIIRETFTPTTYRPFEFMAINKKHAL